MTEFAATGDSRVPGLTRLKDLAALGKPRLSFLVIFTTAVGVWLAPTPPAAGLTLVFLLATSALVASANTFNCWFEKEIDGLMERTCRRPLPAGRMEPRSAVVYGIVLGAAALTVMAVTSNALTVALGAVAWLSYVLVYTPLKRVTPWAVLIGALPGALPPLMGWTLATGELGLPGWFLFGILFLWQLPHFIAISLYLGQDFRRAGIRALPVVHGTRIARWYLLGFVVCLLGFSLLAYPLEIARTVYTVVATVVGLAWVGLAAAGLKGSSSNLWGRRLFGFSLLYLPVLITALVLDAI
jgi:protoheme IX farnesyltransferase